MRTSQNEPHAIIIGARHAPHATEGMKALAAARAPLGSVTLTKPADERL